MKALFNLIIYSDTSGVEPFNDWLNSLDRSVVGKIEARIDRLEAGQFGNAKALKNGLFELKFRSPAFRIYYAIVGKQIILLISGGNKSKQSDDIKKSKKYLDDYRGRHGCSKN